MLEIKFTLDATPELIGALSDIADAIHGVSNHAPTFASDAVHVDPSRVCGNAETREENNVADEKYQNLTDEAPVDPEQAETPRSADEPKKRKHRAKKAPSESDTPVAPAIGDNSSPVGDNSSPACARAEPEPAPPEETHVPGPAPEPSPVEEAPSARAEDPLAGKGQTGEILAELTRKAIGDLDELGVDRGDANRRIRAYCALYEIKFPTFPALLNAVGYAKAIEICKGAMR